MRALERSREQTVRDADAADVALAIAGDATAFERVYGRHVARINGLACWLLGTDDADDAVQDVFVRAWRKLATFRGEAAFGTWLRRLAVNLILRRRAQLGLRRERFGGAPGQLDAMSAPPVSPGLRVDLRAAVSRLPPQAREVFVLHDVEGYKHEEIADVLGVTAGTSRSQLHRARMLLRQHLQG